MEIRIKSLIFGLMLAAGSMPVMAMEQNNLEIAQLDPELLNQLKAAGEQAIAGNLEPLKTFLQKGLNANQVFEFLISDSQLEAAPADAQAFISLLVEFGLKINFTSPRSDYTPLKGAVSKGYIPLMQALIKHGADLNYCGPTAFCPSPLMIAIYANQCDAAFFLIDSGASVNLITGGTNCALVAAGYWGRNTIVKRLIECGARADAGALWSAIYNCDGAAIMYKETIRLLLEYGCDANFINDYNPYSDQNRSCLDLAIMARTDEIEIVELLLKYKANPNLETKNGDFMPLLRACQKPYFRRLANIREANDPLSDVLIQSDLDCLQILLDYGAEIDYQNHEGMTALMYVAGHLPAEILEAVKFLQDEGEYFTKPEEQAELTANIDLTPLAKLLLDNGADRNLRNKEGKTALDIAVECGNLAMIELLEDYYPWGQCDLQVHAARAFIARCATLPAQEVQALIGSIGSQHLREAIIRIAPKAIKDKIDLVNMNDNMQEPANNNNSNN